MLYKFEDYALDTDKRELRRAYHIVELEPQVFDLLEFLIRTRDRVASRDDLLNAVWRGRIVSESTLSSRINAARAAIGDNGADQRLIKTLPRKGIRFVGEVREQEETPTVDPAAPALFAPPAAPVTGGTPAIADGPAIAVLPFNNMSSDQESDYFADGMAEEIITALSHCSGIAVIARNSSFTYKGRAVDVRQVGRDLGVGYVLEGSVRRNAEHVRITAQLIDATSGAHLWADRFDGKLEDVFELQDRIAESAVSIIEPRMRFAEVQRAKRKLPQNLTVYEMWLRAVSLAGELTEASLDAALRELDRALDIDPAQPLIMATAAYYQAQRHFQGWVREMEPTRAKALQLALQAVDLDESDSNVLWMSAFTIWTFDRDAERARELFSRALQINPNSAIALTMSGWVEIALGKVVAGRGMIERSMRLNPRHPRGWFMAAGLAVSHIAEGQFDEALSWAEKAVAQNRRSAVALRALIVALVSVGRVDRARPHVTELLSIEPQLTVSGLSMRLPFQGSLVRTYVEALRAAGLPE